MNIFLRLVKDETFSAYLLIPVALLAILLGAHIDSHFLEQSHQILNWHFTLRELTLDYLLGFFFYNIGLQLRFELAVGALQDRKVLVVSAIAALLGMCFPALGFILFNRANGSSTTGWGATMATDLPLVLALIVILKKSKLKGFVLALATIDDIGSIIVLSVLYQAHLHLLYIFGLGVVLGIYFLFSYLSSSRALLLAIFIFGLAIGHQTGIQTSLVAVLFGILTFNNQKKDVDLHEKLLNLVEPASAFAVVPIFLFVSFFRHFDFSVNAITSRLVLTLVIARLIGKPVGIFFGILIGRLLLKVQLGFSTIEGVLIGALGTLGLSVSLIFAQEDFSGVELNLAIIAILLTIPAGIALISAIHLLSPRANSL